MANQPLIDIPIKTTNQAKNSAQPANGASNPVVNPAPTPTTPTAPAPQNTQNPVSSMPTELPSNQQMGADLQPADLNQITSQANATNSKKVTPQGTIQSQSDSSRLELEDVSHWARPYLKIFRLVLATALTLQGLYGLYQSVIFILIEYPEMEMLLIAGQITQTQVTSLATKAIITLGTTILGLIFAMRIMRSKATKILNTTIGIAIFLFGAYLNTYVAEHFDVISIITQPFLSFFRLIGLASQEIDKTTQQLPIDTSNTPTLIWEQ